MPTRFLRSLTDHTRTVSANLHLGMSLAFIAGGLNSVGFLAFALYTSHMTGIVSSISDNIILGQLRLAGAGVVAVLMFVLGAVSSTILINWARRNRMHSEYALSLLLEAGLLAVFAWQGQWWSSVSVAHFPLAGLLLCFVMGLQNAVATKLSSARIRTTHMTGIVTDIGIELGRLLYWNRSPHKNTHHRVIADIGSLTIHLRIILSFFAGGLFGAFSVQWLGFAAVLVLSCWLVILAMVPVWDDLRGRRRQEGIE